MKELFLIPMPLSLQDKHDNISQEIRNVLAKTDLIIAERARTFRRFLKILIPDIDIQAVEIIELEKTKEGSNEKEILSALKKYDKVGIVSEAGCPGIADPGSFIIEFAHKIGAKVVPLSGPSSILLAQMASGFNGQQFTFHGYLPRERGDLARKIRSMQTEMQSTGYSQIFMETPYRNNRMMEELASNLDGNTMLHISCDLTTDKSLIKTLPVIQWKKMKSLDLHKRPCIFIIGRNKKRR